LRTHAADYLRPLYILLATLVACLSSVAMASGATIVTPGPIKDLVVGPDASCQVSYGDSSFEFFPSQTQPGDCGPFVAVDGELFSPDFASHGSTATSGLGSRTFYEPVSQTDVQGAGTPSSPFTVVTVVRLPGAQLEIQTTVSYVTGASSFRVDLSVREQSGNPRSIRLSWGSDCYASGSDIGYGFIRPEIRSVGCSQTVNNSPGARTIQLSPLSPSSTFLEDFYRTIWENIALRGPLPDTCRCSESLDNGVALSWGMALAPYETATRSLTVAFTESAIPTAPVDSDGDALPDAWETGTGAALDYENLAPLGAAPNRKDIFIHADYMEGCAPTAGWERKAVARFAAHGVTLHIDSGATSLNSDGTPWGTKSRAGVVPLTNPLPLWYGFDAIKDINFVPSNRRRAFYYMLFAPSYVDSTLANPTVQTGGLARGAPDSDAVIANCGWTHRGDATVVTHELGHLLGLLHGGGDSINFKPNYPSIMNYAVALDAIDREGLMLALPDFSSGLRPNFDENAIDERHEYLTPIAWRCPGTAVLRSYSTVVLTRNDLDFDCDGRTGEAPYSLDMTADGTPNLARGLRSASLIGHDDLAPGAMKYGGGGFVGALQLPPRQDGPIVPELTQPEVIAAAAATAAGRASLAKRLLIRPTPRTVQRGRRRIVRIRVLAGGKPVLRAVVRIKGAGLGHGRKQVTTDAAGRATLRLNVVSRTQVVLTATRRGRLTGSTIVRVRRY
jgi:hypothetical protein